MYGTNGTDTELFFCTNLTNNTNSTLCTELTETTEFFFLYESH